jgi:nucleoid-associated protein EbfC
MFNKQNMAQLMQKAKKMQDDLIKSQEKLKTIEVTGESGAGLVKITMTCDYHTKSVKIDENLFKEGDAETIEDLIIGAMNNCFKQINDTTQSNMGDMSGLKNMLPPGMF